VCFAISQIKVAAFFFTYPSVSFRQFSALGKISPSTTVSAKSTVCFAICERAEQTWRLNLASGLANNGAMKDMVLASTTDWASYIKTHIQYEGSYFIIFLSCLSDSLIITSGECLEMSLKADAAILLRDSSGS
jgi:hypothetical protein